MLRTCRPADRAFERVSFASLPLDGPTGSRGEGYRQNEMYASVFEGRTQASEDDSASSTPLTYAKLGPVRVYRSRVECPARVGATRCDMPKQRLALRRLRDRPPLALLGNPLVHNMWCTDLFFPSPSLDTMSWLLDLTKVS